MTITTYDTVFATNDGALATGNILKPAKGEISLLARDGNTLEASAPLNEVVADDGIYDLGDAGAQVPVYNLGVVHSNAVGVLTKTTNFTIASEGTATGKTFVLADAEGQAHNITIAVTGGTVTVTNSTGTISDNGTDTVVIEDAFPGTITYSYTAPVGPDTVTLTVDAQDSVGLNDAVQVSTTITVEAGE